MKYTTVKADEWKDELYALFFKCQTKKCDNHHILYKDKYCGGCGRKIKWTKDQHETNS